jgi:hypothetical protein
MGAPSALLPHLHMGGIERTKADLLINRNPQWRLN